MLNRLLYRLVYSTLAILTNTSTILCPWNFEKSFYILILDPLNASNNSVMQEEATVPNPTQLVAVANNISYDMQQSLVLVEEMQEKVDLFFSSL